MDIEELKKYSQNKIEADNLIKQVRQQIKETTWEKQNLREGFTETFKPLISQFEKPEEDSKRENIFTQNQKMLQNQLALTEGLKANQKAITDGFNQFEKLADMQKLGAIEDEDEDEEEEEEEEEEKEEEKEEEEKVQAPLPKENKSQITITKDYFDRYLINKEAKDVLKNYKFAFLPSYYFDKDIQEVANLKHIVDEDLEELNEKIKSKVIFKTDQEGYEIAESSAKKRGPIPETKIQIINYNVLKKYQKNLDNLYNFKKIEKTGSGLFINPQELLHRFELLNGSLAAGNNGVLPEYIQIAHRLRDIGILSNNQLNKLLRKVI